jgi:pyruvate dehydrogenase E1 component
VVTIIREGMRRMYEAQEDVYYYVTLMNENYPHPGLKEAGEGAEEGILKGLYRIEDCGLGQKGKRVQLLGSGSILREVLEAAKLLEADYRVAADVYSATSFNELRRDGMETERWNRLHPTEPRRMSWVRSSCPAERVRWSRPRTTFATTRIRFASMCRLRAVGMSCWGLMDSDAAIIA